MNNQEQFDKKLETAIGQLKELEPKELSWASIASQLDFEKNLDKSIDNLPEFEFKEDCWNNIEIKLEKNHKTKTNTKIKKLIVYSLSAAAAIAILISVPRLINLESGVEISHSQEVLIESEMTDDFKPKETNPIKYLEENCKTVPEVCESPEFLEQKKLLEELNMEHENLTKTIENYGESPELIKSLIKIENLKSDIVKEMIKTLNS